ncbi:MAG: hypothetical protein ACOC7R_00250 [Planctomycetota bacterium]
MSFTGYRLYRGRGGASAIDWTTPVATVPAGQATVDLAGAGHEAGAVYTYALRPVRDDVESPDCACLVELALDAAGEWPGDRPAPVTGLAAAAADGGVRVHWHWRADPDGPAADRFAVFVGTAPEVPTDVPVATVAVDGDGAYSAAVTAIDGAVYVAVRAEIDGGVVSTLATTGPVVVPPAPAMPTPWVDVSP